MSRRRQSLPTLMSNERRADVAKRRTADRWPDDFVALDRGRLRIRADCVEVFRGRGWDTLDAIMNGTNVRVVRHVAQRDNCEVDLPAPDGAGVIRGYLKRHWSDCFGEWCGRLVQRRRWLPPGLAEAEAVGWCQRAGVNTMSVIAVGAEVGPAPWQARSFFMSQQLDAAPADDFWVQRMGRPGDGLATPGDRTRLLEALADTANRFHSAGLFHRDFYWCHFFVSEPVPGGFSVYLIDLQRVLESRWMRWRWLIKDLAQFRFSVPKGCLTKAEWRNWFQRYCGRPDRRLRDRIGETLVDGRASLYHWKEARR